MRILQASFRALAVDNEHGPPALTVGLHPTKPIVGNDVGGTCIEHVCHADMTNQQHSTQSGGFFPLPLTEISATAQCANRVSTKPFPYQERSKVKIQIVLY